MYPHSLTTLKRKPIHHSSPMETLPAIDLDDDDDDIVFVSKSKRRFTDQQGKTKADAITVETFDQDRDLQAAIRASRSPILYCVDWDSDDDDDEIQLLWSKSPLTNNFFSNRSVTETGESSTSSVSKQFECEICAETKPAAEAFSTAGCTHSYCAGCVANYVAAKLSDNVTAIGCPAPWCSASLDVEHCREILPQEVFERWGMALCEAEILSTGKVVYCPFKDCSVAMVDDGGDAVVEAVCWSCYRMFCAKCRVGWHAGVVCEEFQQLGKDERDAEDLLLMKLAKSKDWKRCPKCSFYVERIDGCLYGCIASF